MTTHSWVCCILVCASLQAQQRNVAFIDVTVVPMDHEHFLPHKTVVTEGGLVKTIGSTARVRIPERAQRVDGRGRFLMPGLADMHVHLNVRGAAGVLTNEAFATLFVANGITTVRNMWGNADILAFRDDVERGTALGPQIYSTGPLTDGDPPVRPTSRIVRNASEAAAAVTTDKQMGFNAIKVYDHLSPEAYEAIIATARDVGLPVYGHVPTSLGVEKVIQARQDSIEHVEGYLTAMDGDSSPQHAADLAASTRAFGVWNCVTLVFFQGIVSPEEGSELLSKPSMQYVPEALRMVWRGNRQFASLTRYQFERIRLQNDKRLRFVATLHAAGARILAGTDTPNPYIVPGFSLHEELSNLVKAGMTPYEALQAATSGAAEFLRSQDRWGTVSVGLRADLLLLEANPLNDVANAARRVGVMVHGKWIPEAELKARLSALQQKQ